MRDGNVVRLRLIVLILSGFAAQTAQSTDAELVASKPYTLCS